MRADTLAMLLTMANIGAHGRALVLDGCGGLVTGAVAERMGGFGQVLKSQDPLNLAEGMHASTEISKASQKCYPRPPLAEDPCVSYPWPLCRA